jgi:DNA-binding transcriptional LysR family regulator
MREDIRGLKHGLTGQLRIAVIPAALPMVAAVTRPLHAHNPDIRFRILSRPSTTIAPLLENLEIDAAITYVDAEPATRITTIPLYRERYQLVMARDFPGPEGDSVTWAEVAELPLCLLTPDTQNRQFIEALLRGAGGNPRITLESDSMTILFAHIREGSWASVMPEHLWRSTRMSKGFRALPIVEPEVVHTIGLIMPVREPTTPLMSALAVEARRVAVRLMPLAEASAVGR